METLLIIIGFLIGNLTHCVVTKIYYRNPEVIFTIIDDTNCRFSFKKPIKNYSNNTLVCMKILKKGGDYNE